MNFQSGIFYFDGRRVPDRDVAMLVGSVRSDETEPSAGTSAGPEGRPARRSAQTTHLQRGVFLAAQNHEGAGGITFDGRLDKREELLQRVDNSAFAEISDGALAFTFYEKWGLDGLAHLVGDWSLAIWDASRKSIVLASDFAGVRPLYYCVEQNRVVWSTRLQPLVDFAGKADIDDEYAGAFMLGRPCPNRTPYRSIRSVPPGHAVSISADGCRIQQYWKLPIGETVRYSDPTQYEEHLRTLFAEAVQQRLRGAAPAISELSGGLDSSSIVCMAHHLIETGALNAKMATVTLERKGSLDTPFYTAVEQHCGFEHFHIPVEDHPLITKTDTGDTRPAFSHLLKGHISKVARQFGARTYLTGELGDLIMGNWWDDSDQVAGLLRRGRIGTAFEQSLEWSKLRRVPIWWVLGKAFLTSLPPTLTLDRYPALTDGSYAPRSSEDSLERGFRKRIGLEKQPSLAAWRHAPPERRKHFRGLIETLALRKLQPPEPLEHLDYTHPYSHRPLVVFMSSIPPEVVCGPRAPRRLMRAAFQPFWPAEIRRRRSKDSFGGVYLDALRPLAVMLLQEDRPYEVVERGWVDSKSLKTRMERMLHSLDCNESQLRQIMLLELWLRGRQDRLRLNNLPLPA